MTTQTEQVLAECLALLLEERKKERLSGLSVADLILKLNEAQAEITQLKEELAATKHNFGPAVPVETRSPVQDF